MSVKTFESMDTQIQLAVFPLLFSSSTTCRNQSCIAKIMPAFFGVFLQTAVGVME